MSGGMGRWRDETPPSKKLTSGGMQAVKDNVLKDYRLGFQWRKPRVTELK